MSSTSTANAAGTKIDEIVDAYVDLLVSQGVRGASIDAVAKRCGLSKAGLLHHTPSRAALDDALLDRLGALAAEDMASMRALGGGAPRYYLASSLDASSPLERAVVAATRLAQSGSAAASEALQRARDRWYGILLDVLGDPALARLVLFAGDGLSYHTDISADAATDPFIARAKIDEVAELIDGLARQRGAAASGRGGTAG